jgi:hypothetical protein
MGGHVDCYVGAQGKLSQKCDTSPVEVKGITKAQGLNSHFYSQHVKYLHNIKMFWAEVTDHF